MPTSRPAVRVGDEAVPTEIALSRTDFVRYAGVSGDFNPMHHDETKAVAAGMPSVFAPGMLNAGILASAVTDWLGPDCLTRFAVRFTKQVWPGVPLSTRVVVVGADEASGTVEVSCQLVDSDGNIVVQGQATARVGGRRP
ncbi:MAG: MaoC domain protein dehydratase [Frankiales bacterium]|nr:MaoC domain protein dehydratase [Frankiales bacterium]